MSDLIKEEINELKKELSKLSNLSDEYLFSLVCYKYFYNSGSLDIKDYKSCFVDGRSDGGIDLIAISETEANQASLVFIQSKYVSSIRNKQDIIDIFTKIHQTISNFQQNNTSQYNSKLKRIYKERLDDVVDQSLSYEMVLFINIDFDEKRKKQIEDEVKNVDSLKDYIINIYYKDEIIDQISNIKEPSRFVPEGKLEFQKEDGCIKYTNDGLLVNVYANSIRDLYDRYKDNGLFGQNFRYYIRNKKIDDNITNSLKKKRDKFWYLNNGIIIGCKDFHPDGNKIKLWDFSIINGCQTATLIGDYSGENQGEDFVLPCKIVKSDEEKFISEIAEASNSQKPISDRDLKSNFPEQRKLKELLSKAKPAVFLEIKRGEDKPSKRGKEDWQFVKNDFLGQLILSFMLQQPGTARSNKKKIFSDNIAYSTVFRRKHDSKTIIDLLRLHNYYVQYMNKRDEFTDSDEESVVLNGTFIIIATIGFMLKVKRNLINVKHISNPEKWESEIKQDDLSDDIFKNDVGDDFIDVLDGLFSKIVSLLYNIYTARKNDEKTVTNFFKIDTKYRDVILKHIIQNIYNNKIELKDLTQKYLNIFN